MIVWNGRILKHTSYWDYNLYYMWDDPLNRTPPCKWGWGPLCHTDSMWRGGIDYRDPIASWGYLGAGAKQLALALLGFTLAGFNHEWYDGMVYCGTHQHLYGVVKKYHIPFAEEILANLPDNWTLTEIDILEWLNKKEKEAFYKEKR